MDSVSLSYNLNITNAGFVFFRGDVKSHDRFSSVLPKRVAICTAQGRLARLSAQWYVNSVDHVSWLSALGRVRIIASGSQ